MSTPIPTIPTSVNSAVLAGYLPATILETNPTSSTYVPISFSALVNSAGASSGTDGFQINAPTNGALYYYTGSTYIQLTTFGTDTTVANFASTVNLRGTGLYIGNTKVGSDGLLYWAPANYTSGSITAFTITAVDNVDNVWGNDSSGVGHADLISVNAANVNISVTPVNQAPSLTLSNSGNFSGTEDTNVVNAAVVSSVNFGTGDVGQAVDHYTVTVVSESASIVTGGASAELFAVAPTINNAGQLSYTLNPNVNGTATLSVTVTDNGGTANGGHNTSAAQTLNVSVASVNDAPVLAIAGTHTGPVNGSNQVVFSTGNGNAISVSDVDAGTNNITVTVTADVGTLTLASETGLANAGSTGSGGSSVTLTGSQSQINADLQGLIFDSTGVPSFNGATIHVDANDNGNTGGAAQTAVEQTFTVVGAPIVTAFTSSTADGSYGAGSGGAVINITATMNKSVTAGSHFDVTLDTGATVTLTAAGAGTTLTGSYTVHSGDHSSDLTVSSFTAGSVVSSVGAIAMTDTTVPSGHDIADTSAIVVDGIAPTLSSIADQTPASGPTNADSLTYRVTFSEPVSLHNSDFTVTGSTATVTGIVSAGGNAYDVTISGGDLAGANATVTLGFHNPEAVTDVVAHNANALALPASTASYVVDNTPPTITGFDASPNGNTSSYGVGSVIHVVATASENVTGSTVVSLDSGGTVTLTGNGTTTLTGDYTVGSGQNSGDLAVSSYTLGSITDTAGNAMAAHVVPVNNIANNNGIVIDTTAPTLVSLLDHTPSGATPTNATSLVFEATFSEAVAGVNAADFAASGSTATVTNVTGAGTTWDITVSGGNIATYTGTETLSFASGETITDAMAHNPNALAHPGATASYNVDNAAPYVTAFDASPSVNTSSYGVGEALTITATVSQLVQAGSHFTATLDDGGTVVLSTVGAGTTLTGTYTVGAGQNSTDLTVASFNTGNVADIAGNNMTSTALPTGSNIADTNGIVIDTTAPTVTSFADLTPAGSPTNATSLVYEVTFSEAVTGVDTADFHASGSTATVTNVHAVNASTYDVTVSGGNLSSYTGTETLGFAVVPTITDAVVHTPNALAVHTASASYTVDHTPPTILAFHTVDPGPGLDGDTNSYALNGVIHLEAVASETVTAGSTFNVTLDTGAVVTLTAAANGTTLTGDYTVGAGQQTLDLTVSSFTAGSVTDLAGNAMVAHTVPGTNYIADNNQIVIDTVAPTSTIDAASYVASTDTLTLTGTNMNEMLAGNVVNPATNVISQLDLTKVLWNDGDGHTTTLAQMLIHDADVSLGGTHTLASAIAGLGATAYVLDNYTLQVDLPGMASSTTGFGTSFLSGHTYSAMDSLSVSAGFISDQAGNLDTLDAASNVPVIGAINQGGMAMAYTADMGILGNNVINTTLDENTGVNGHYYNDYLTFDPTAGDTITLTGASAAQMQLTDNTGVLELKQYDSWGNWNGSDYWLQLSGLSINSTLDGSAVKFADGSMLLVNNTGHSMQLVGGVGADQLVAGNQGDRLIGNGGNDLLIGGAGSDAIYGGTGNDIIYGAGGNDYLNGGQGGGTTFVYANDFNAHHTAFNGNDVIVNFQTGVANPGNPDVIFLAGAGDSALHAGAGLVFDGVTHHLLASSTAAIQSGNDTLLLLNDGETIRLMGVTETNLTTANFAAGSFLLHDANIGGY